MNGKGAVAFQVPGTIFPVMRKKEKLLELAVKTDKSLSQKNLVRELSY